MAGPLRPYFHDATALLLQLESPSPVTKAEARVFFRQYFQAVLDGRHVIGREFEYINMNPWNRVAFCRAALDTYPSSALRGGDVSLDLVYHSIVVLCPDFPRALVELAARLLVVASPSPSPSALPAVVEWESCSTPAEDVLTMALVLFFLADVLHTVVEVAVSTAGGVSGSAVAASAATVAAQPSGSAARPAFAQLLSRQDVLQLQLPPATIDNVIERLSGDVDAAYRDSLVRPLPVVKLVVEHLMSVKSGKGTTIARALRGIHIAVSLRAFVREVFQS